MSTSVKDVVQSIVRSVDSIAKDETGLDLLLKIEASLFMEKLNKLLNDPALLQCTLPATRENLHQFCTLFHETWNFNKKTDAISCHSPSSYVNRLRMLIATKLAGPDGDAYDILMPPLKSKNYTFPNRGNLSALKPHEFILDDKDETPIWVSNTLTMACNDKKHNNDPLSLLMSESPKGDKLVKSLSWFENQRVKNHSKNTKEFSRLMQSTSNITEVKNRLHHSFNTENYQVTASYGEEGKKLLLKNILNTIHNREDFISLLSNHVPIAEWEDFFKLLKDEDVFRLFLGINCDDIKEKNKNADTKKIIAQKADDKLQELFEQLLKSDHLTVNNDMEGRASLFLIQEVYNRYRPYLPEYKTTSGYIASMFYLPIKTSSYSEKEKIDSLPSYRQFIYSKHPLEQIQKYYIDNKLHKQWGALSHTSYASQISSYIAKPSVLSQMTSLTIKIGETLRSQELKYRRG
ncbi:MAG: hypothetical protein JO149_08230 [Gammaproteobacteria bacterium]|nr:hypothetical protein [Gammaproteobacteria bacterium]